MMRLLNAIDAANDNFSGICEEELLYGFNKLDE